MELNFSEGGGVFFQSLDEYKTRTADQLSDCRGLDGMLGGMLPQGNFEIYVLPTPQKRNPVCLNVDSNVSCKLFRDSGIKAYQSSVKNCIGNF